MQGLAIVAVLLMFAALIAVIYFLWKTIVSSGHRRKMLGRAGLAAIAAFVLAAFTGFFASEHQEQQKKAAEEAGFESVEAYEKAQKVGAETPEEYQERLAKLEARKKREQEEAEERRRAEEAVEKAKQQACRRTLQCWGDEHSIDAEVACPPYIERLARFQAEWTDGFLEQKFSRLRWKDKKAGVITYIGDKVKFQNGFGAWQHMTYECDYDPSAETVIDVRVSPGRL